VEGDVSNVECEAANKGRFKGESETTMERGKQVCAFKFYNEKSDLDRYGRVKGEERLGGSTKSSGLGAAEALIVRFCSFDPFLLFLGALPSRRSVWLRSFRMEIRGDLKRGK
jgi:hypothetical protein